MAGGDWAEVETALEGAGVRRRIEPAEEAA